MSRLIGAALIVTMAMPAGRWVLADESESVEPQRLSESAPADAEEDPSPAGGQLSFILTGGEVGISGATLFRDFFEFTASTNDWINADCDFDCLATAGDCISGALGDEEQCDGGANTTNCAFRGYIEDRQDCQPFPVDILATTTPLSGGPVASHWLVNYRAVGSGNGVQDFVDHQVSFLNSYHNAILSPRYDANSDGYIGDQPGCSAACSTVDDMIWTNVCGASNACGDKCNLSCVCTELGFASDCTPADVAGFYGCTEPACTFCELFIPLTNPSEPSNINRLRYYDPANVTGTPGCANESSEGGWATDPDCPDSCQFICMRSIDLGSTDVPVAWFEIAGDPVDSDWDRKPTESGYGQNVNLGYDIGFGGQSNELKNFFFECNGIPGIQANERLNNNSDSPDNRTIVNNNLAHSVVAMIANRRTGVEEARQSELQHHFVTGRFPSGKNYIASTRDSGSGTRNTAMNGLCIDPSWGRGDNIGLRIDSEPEAALGPRTQRTHCGGSSIMENGVRNAGLAIGYTGAVGPSRTAHDVAKGRYEAIGVMFDDPELGGTQFIRPTRDAILDNATGNSFRISAGQTLATRGDVNGNRLPGDPLFDPSVNPVNNQAAADYIINILDSLRDFQPANPGDQFLMPGELLARDFFGPAGIDALPSDLDPCSFDIQEIVCNDDNDCPNGTTCSVSFAGTDYCSTGFSPVLQDFMRNNLDMGSGGTFNGDMPGYRAVNGTDGGQAPNRIASPDFPPFAESPGAAGGTEDRYSDGSLGGEYCYYNASDVLQTALGAGIRMSAANDLMGDFNGDNVVDLLDVPDMVAACYQPRIWQRSGAGDGGGVTGSMSHDQVIPEVIGDFNGDGNFDKEDLRYFADGLYLDGTGNLDRDAAWEAIDNEIINQFGEAFLPWCLPVETRYPAPAAEWSASDAVGVRCQDLTVAPVVCQAPSPAGGGTLLATGAPYAAGDAKADIAGSSNGPAKGAQPLGSDGVVDATDVDYIVANAGDWTILDTAKDIDLSADMNGDLMIDGDDVCETVVGVLKTNLVDLNLDGSATCADYASLMIGGSASYSNGDVNASGAVDACDEKIFLRELRSNFDTNADTDFDLDDLMCVQDGFQGVATSPCDNVDVFPPCSPDAQVNLFDILLVLDSINNWADPSCQTPTCGSPSPAPVAPVQPLIVDADAPAALRVVPRELTVAAGGTVTVDVFVDAKDLRGYQIALDAEMRQGSAEIASALVDEADEDYVFAGATAHNTVDLAGARAIGSIVAGGMDATGAYLGTFTFEISKDATGVVKVFVANATMLRDSNRDAIGVGSVSNGLVRVIAAPATVSMR